ncbi:MAG: Smr/MutS family protein [Cycloclasticus sp.]|nr:Smr/MutS family protein [Cycloclasticus sp.]
MPEDKNKHLSSDEDYLLFQQSMSDVKPIKTDKYNPIADKPKLKPTKRHIEQHTQAPEFITEEHDSIKSADSVFFARQGLQHKTIRRLKRGAFSIDDVLDLHGLNKQQAHVYLAGFLVEQIENKHRCVMIIHGKGTGSENQYPILKNFTFNFLKSQASVLAITSAQQRDGGTGAVYVLLKSHQSSGV